ncbi:bacterio-opsin activator domain-containing protein [Candidatus Halobonum tyrrellensis]|uniref:Putative PAS/PAC sensor protein n=1 Tax=Candidatus Halobonum tyrrellensis G22 TaxID=1324957 RepID=V4GY49_9EURY|nr:bacterio-opsin activator domain-containing protein [Candidatus Halobonum tyrrellensis]ESP90111.1 putative PAS/PAC sensor protein [Candidatus Halobonum tyrrellensis G22]
MHPASSALDSARVLLSGTSDWVERFAEVLRTRTTASVLTVPTVEETLETVSTDDVDCLVVDYEFDESTGIDLLRSVRAETASLPVVMCTAAGSEAIASEAVAAGVTDYVALDGRTDEWGDDLLERTEQCVRSARRTVTQRDRARQFDAIFHDTETATWVLDPDGSLERANRTARAAIDADIDSVVGRPFWSLPWWSRGARTRADVQRTVERASSGAVGNTEVSVPAGDGTTRTLDLSARPVEDERGELVSIIVEGVDITERVELERDLRRSEELHRVTLNNMTDTVLITNESREYTYVCPNVHFVFGYDAEEIYEQGTIDALLGDDLFDREELAEEGVLKNIECTATDKAGREHRLLVNVREVSIQGGTLLYSCRDITKRKQREDALATLHETTRDFLYAGTHREIAQHIVDDTPSVLDLDASMVYLFDAEENQLRPIAWSSSMEELNGPFPTVHADGKGVTSHSFVEDEPLFFDDVHDAEEFTNRATEIRSAAVIPLGDHGVYVVGSPEVGVFDEVRRELADLLAATAEAALDRVTRETQLREQDRELQRQNAQLTALNRINETIREIDQAIVRAETREEIDHTVCELLTADDRFGFAWIGRADPLTETVDPTAWAGAERGYLDSLTFPVGGAETEPTGRTASTREATTVTNVAARLRAEPWRKEALARDYLSVLSIPLVYNDLTYGVLSVYAETQDAFDETSREVLVELGETIASAISAIERKNALLTTSMTRLEFDVDDPSFVLARLAREADCSLSYDGGVQQTSEGAYVFVTVEEGTVEAVEAAAGDLVAVDGVHRITADGTGGVVRLRLSQPFLALELADHGAVLRTATADPDGTTLVVDIPESVDVRHITGLVGETFTRVELRSKQTFDRASESTLYSRFFEELTDRQLEVVQTAYYSGFFESPRDSTGEEVAETLGISPPAFHKHVRTVQRKLFSTLFDEGGRPTAPQPTAG